jgi:hypothetical protein
MPADFLKGMPDVVNYMANAPLSSSEAQDIMVRVVENNSSVLYLNVNGKHIAGQDVGGYQQVFIQSSEGNLNLNDRLLADSVDRGQKLCR